jgi:S1-C subfamily serine protease
MEAGLKTGDIIIEVDREPVSDRKMFVEKMKQYKTGDTILLLVNRERVTLYVTLKVE